MTDLSDYTEGIVIDWMTQGSDAPSAPANLYVALHDGFPGDDGASNEVDNTEYSRVETSTGTDWDAVGEDTFENSVEVNWGTVESLWGSITHVTIWDSQTGGNCIGIMPLTASVTPQQGNQIVAEAEMLTFAIDGDGAGGGGGIDTGYGSSYGSNYGG